VTVTDEAVASVCDYALAWLAANRIKTKLPVISYYTTGDGFGH
jgi:hypothetical protein